MFLLEKGLWPKVNKKGFARTYISSQKDNIQNVRLLIASVVNGSTLLPEHRTFAVQRDAISTSQRNGFGQTSSSEMILLG